MPDFTFLPISQHNSDSLVSTFHSLGSTFLVIFFAGKNNASQYKFQIFFTAVAGVAATPAPALLKTQKLAA